MPGTSVRPLVSQGSIDFCLPVKALLLAAVGHTPSTPTPRPGARVATLCLLLPLLSPPNLGLPSFPHVSGSSWLVSKGLAVFQRARSARRLANALPPPPGARAPLGGPPPAPPPVVPQPPPLELARGAVSARAGGKPAPAHLPLAAPARQQQRRFPPRRTGRTPEPAAPPPPRLFFLSQLRDLAARAWKGSEKRRARYRSAGFRCSLPTELGYCTPGVPTGPRRPSWDVTKGSPQRLPPALEEAPRERTVGRRGAGDLGRSLFARSAAGQERQGAPGAGSQHPLLRKRAVGITAFPALGATPRPAACSWTESRFPPIHPELGTAPSRPPALAVALAPRHLYGSPTPSAEPRDSQPLQRPRPLEGMLAAAS